MTWEALAELCRLWWDNECRITETRGPAEALPRSGNICLLLCFALLPVLPSSIFHRSWYCPKCILTI